MKIGSGIGSTSGRVLTEIRKEANEIVKFIPRHTGSQTLGHEAAGVMALFYVRLGDAMGLAGCGDAELPFIGGLPEFVAGKGFAVEERRLALRGGPDMDQQEQDNPRPALTICGGHSAKDYSVTHRTHGFSSFTQAILARRTETTRWIGCLAGRLAGGPNQELNS